MGDGGGKASLPTFVRVQPEEKLGSHNEWISVYHKQAI